MHVDWMEAQYFQFSFEHFLPSLVQLCTGDSVHNTLWILIKASPFPLVKELQIFVYK
jgi:hypothetical protein